MKIHERKNFRLTARLEMTAIQTYHLLPSLSEHINYLKLLSLMLIVKFKGERFQYHSKSKERLIYYTRIIKDFHTIADLVVAYTNYYYTKVIYFVVAIPTIAIGDKALWPRNHRNFRSS
jgi:hypothetical protein